ncbi:MAG: 2,3-bisphosphoglycerate-dependent phosphoglycerate mutase [Nitrospirales bacterium]|nr:MAG: 2,3-bisphosphoglycerate-dependent phosphoglycerate mutase [Nitrospirales bacterium]
MGTLILLRHGQSLWNREKRFTGWTDIELSKKGVMEAQRAAQILKDKRVTFDLCFTSVLCRAHGTAGIVLKAMNLTSVPVRRSWRLNERHYGALQGMTWWEASSQFGPKQVLIWQRHFSAVPPLISSQDPRFPGLDPLYSDLDSQDLPLAESIKCTQHRLIPYWQEEIAPALQEGKRVLLVAHNNSIRSLLQFLLHLDEAGIKKVTVKTGEPLVCKFDARGNLVSYSYMWWKPKLKDCTQKLLNYCLP